MKHYWELFLACVGPALLLIIVVELIRRMT